MKKESHNPIEPIEKQHYKKRFLLRKQQEEEAEKELKEYEGREPPEPRVD